MSVNTDVEVIFERWSIQQSSRTLDGTILNNWKKVQGAYWAVDLPTKALALAAVEALSGDSKVSNVVERVSTVVYRIVCTRTVVEEGIWEKEVL